MYDTTLNKNDVVALIGDDKIIPNRKYRYGCVDKFGKFWLITGFDDDCMWTRKNLSYENIEPATAEELLKLFPDQNFRCICKSK